MSNAINLMEYLREIEDTTDLNGCFFINVESYKVIESTIPFAVPEEILWELSVLRDTFQQFGKGFRHGDLQELMIEGDRGYILFYNIPPHLILLAMGKYDINLTYVKLAMIDVLKNIRKEIFEIGDEVLNIPAKGFGKLGKEAAPSIPTAATSEPARIEPDIEAPITETTIEEAPIAEPSIEAPITETTIEEAPIAEPAIEAPITETTIEEAAIAEPAIEAPITETAIEEALIAEPAIEAPITETIIEKTPIAEPSVEEKLDLPDLIDSIKGKSAAEINDILKIVFDVLKKELSNLSGNKFSEVLELLKDAILETIGTSLALFDISRTSREINKVYDILKPNDIEKYKDRIDNWAKRIIKT